MKQIKSAIIGKAWKNGESGELMPASFVISEDTVFSANQSFILGHLTFRTDRNLTVSVPMKKGSLLNLFANKKRDGHKDADFSVSVLLPVDEANTVINATKAGVAAWKASNA